MQKIKDKEKIQGNKTKEGKGTPCLKRNKDNNYIGLLSRNHENKNKVKSLSNFIQCSIGSPT